MDQHSHRRPRSLQQAALGLAFCGTLAGVLIWTKLRLATDVPRSAYAVPRESAGPEKPQQTPLGASADSEEDAPPTEQDPTPAGPGDADGEG